MGAARVGNLLVGLAMLPLLMHYLGGEEFAAWAVLLAAGAMFATLDLGSSTFLKKEVAVALAVGDAGRLTAALSNRQALMVAVFFAGFPWVVLFGDALAETLRLPPAGLVLGVGVLHFVFLCVAARALLDIGTTVLFAAQRFRAIALISFCQGAFSNLAAIAAAVLSGHLAVVLVVYWATQLLVVGVVYAYGAWIYRWRLRIAALNWPTVRAMVQQGASAQLHDLAQVVNFQFDKLLVAALVGLWAVAPYEVANRGIQALRSLPMSSLDLFLPTAAVRQHEVESAWVLYQRVSRWAVYGAVLLVLLPLAVSPLFLYAWAGQMGTYGQWVFLALSLGVLGTLIAAPAAMLAQATGQAALTGRAAAASMLSNIPLSWSLVHLWGIEGAAFGTAMAMLGGSAYLLLLVHRHFQKPLRDTVVPLLRQLWPHVVVSVTAMLLIYAPFEYWLRGLPADIRYSIDFRLAPAVIAAAMYFLLVVLAVVIELYRAGLRHEEIGALGRLVPIRGLRERILAFPAA